MRSESLETAAFLPGRCLIQLPPPPEISDGGLFYAEQYAPMPSHGWVVSCGPPLPTKGRATVEPEFKVGDYVLLNRWAGHHPDLDDRKDLVIVNIDDVIAVIEEDPDP